jgi:cytochrome c oxidase subunit 4
MTDTATVHAEHAEHDEHAHAHPADIHYVRIAIVLAVITAIEVAWAYLGLDTVPEIAGLMFFMAIKFFLVASQFMHLKFDARILTFLFYAGLFLAVSVYLIALFTFRIFNI